MFTKNINLLLLILIIALFLIVGQNVFAATVEQNYPWTAPQSTPPDCYPSKDGLGCFSPVNVGNVLQIKAGSLGLGGDLGLTPDKAVDFASTLAMPGERANYAGRIAYKKSYDLDWNGVAPYTEVHTGVLRSLLNIIGGGMREGDRLVKIWDNLDVVGTTTTGSLYAQNYYVCNSSGACSPLTTSSGSTNFWTALGTDAITSARRVFVNSSSEVSGAGGSTFQVKLANSVNNGLAFQTADGSKTWRFIFGRANVAGDTNPGGFSIYNGISNVFNIKDPNSNSHNASNVVITSGLVLSNGLLNKGEPEAAAGELCLGGVCKNAWPSASAPVVKRCVYYLDGRANQAADCPAPSYSASSDSGTMYCPAGYTVMSGGVACSKGNRIESSVLTSTNSWFVNCQNSIVSASISCLKTN